MKWYRKMFGYTPKRKDFLYEKSKKLRKQQKQYYSYKGQVYKKVNGRYVKIYN